MQSRSARTARPTRSSRSFRSLRSLRCSAVHVASSARCSPHPRAVRLELVPYDPGSAAGREYRVLQHRILVRHGIATVQRAGDTCARSCSHLVLARAADGALLGGMRIHRRDRGLLPVEAALPGCLPLQALLGELDSLVELSGAVVAPAARKTGVSAALVRAAVAAVAMLDQHSVVGFGHQHVLGLYARFGLVPDPRLSPFPYPDLRYQSSVLVLRDTRLLPGVAAGERCRIRDIGKQLSSHARLVISPDPRRRSAR